MPDPDDHVDAGSNGTRRQFRKRIDVQTARIDIGQFTGVDVVKVMMIVGIRVVEDPCRIDNHFPDQTVTCKQSQRVVDSRLGYVVIVAVDHLQDLVGRQVLLPFEEHAGDQDALMGWQYAVPLQHFPD